MGSLPSTSYGDITDADDRYLVGLLLEDALVKQEITQADPCPIEQGEEIEEGITALLHYLEKSTLISLIFVGQARLNTTIMSRETEELL